MIKSFKILLAISVLCGAVFLQPSAEAAEVSITWTDPDKYRDIFAGNENKKHFRKNTFKELEKHFSLLSKKLPENQTLEIEVTNIDLAGDVHHGGINQVRIVKDIYFPRFEFSFKLLNADGMTILAKKEKINDMGFMNGVRLKYRNRKLSYEKQMLDDWFTKTFENYVIK